MPQVHLFIYGSLLAPSVLRALLDREPAQQAAWLPGFRRAALRGQAFPGIAPAAGARTAGALIDVCRRELGALDAWEDDFFQRRRVGVRLPAGGALDAQAYVLAPRYRHLLAARPWSAEDFVRRLAPACAQQARHWRRDRNPGLRHT
jgi:gamma-glutamylcyclotransferase (GGCT)/AIG2-like uncharacterized protein YtfP